MTFSEILRALTSSDVNHAYYYFKLFLEFACFLSDMQPYIHLDKVSQFFICWRKETEFDKALYLASKLDLRYPNIEVYVRIFDEELKDLVEKCGAQTFSTSENAFRKLQNEVLPDSTIALKK